MKFEEALAAMRQGKKVMIPPAEYHYLIHNDVLMKINTGTNDVLECPVINFHVRYELLSENWEILEKYMDIHEAIEKALEGYKIYRLGWSLPVGIVSSYLELQGNTFVNSACRPYSLDVTEIKAKDWMVFEEGEK